jgi:hypothetical protein
MDNRPYLRIAEPRRGKKFLSVSQAGVNPKIKCLKSFGSADNTENWIAAIDYLMRELRIWYFDQMNDYFEPEAKST